MAGMTSRGTYPNSRKMPFRIGRSGPSSCFHRSTIGIIVAIISVLAGCMPSASLALLAQGMGYRFPRMINIADPWLDRKFLSNLAVCFRDETRLIQKGGNRWGVRLALNRDNADDVTYIRLRYWDRADWLGKAQHLGKVQWHDGGPLARADMREKQDHRVRFQRRLYAGACFFQMLVDDAAVLHVRREKAERQLRHL